MQHHLENAIMSIRKAGSFSKDHLMELEGVEKILGTKALLLCSKSEMKAFPIFFTPGSRLTTPTRAAQKLGGKV